MVILPMARAAHTRPPFPVITPPPRAFNPIDNYPADWLMVNPFIEPTLCIAIYLELPYSFESSMNNLF